MDTLPAPRSIPWNKGSLVGPKPPLKLKEIWLFESVCSSPIA